MPAPTSSDRSRNFSRLRLARLQAELSRCMYSQHGFEPLMRPVLAAVCQWLIVVSNCMPGIGALPGGLGDLAHEVAGLDRADDRAVGDGPQVPVGVVDDGLHELVGDPDGVVGVLVLDRRHVLAVEAHVEAGLLEDPDLLLLAGLDPDELLDVGVVDVEDDHLGGAAGLAART